MADDTQPKSYGDALAKAVADMRARQEARAAAAAAGVPEELYGGYSELKNLLAAGKSPASPKEAAQYLATAAALAKARGDKPAVLAGTKDLAWPPNFESGAPLNYLPYLPQWRQVMALTFPQKPAAAKARPAAERQVPREDALAQMRAMLQKAGKDVSASTKPLALENTVAGAPTDSDTADTDIPSP